MGVKKGGAVLALLDPKASERAWLEGLINTGLSVGYIAEALAVTEDDVRGAVSGEGPEILPGPRIVLQDLRSTMYLLLKGESGEPGFDPDEAVAWVLENDRAHCDGDRRIDHLRTDPLAVLAAAHGEFLGEVEESDDPE